MGSEMCIRDSPLKVRGRAMSIATLSNWLANLLVTFTFPLMITTIGTSISFWVYASMGMANLIFAFFLVPETKGYTLEEIEAWWRKKQTDREWNEACGS